METKIDSFEIPTAEEWLAKGIARPKPIVSNGLLNRRNLTVYGALDDSYKSWLLCQLAVCLASGRDWLSFSTAKCDTIVYLVMEGSMEYLIERVENISVSFGLDWDEIQKHVRFKEYLYENLDDEENAAILQKSLRKVNPDVVICDPITYMIAQDTRYSPVMVQVGNNLLRIARDLDCAVLAVMHCRKGTGNDDNMDDIVGSGQLKNMASTRIKLYRGLAENEHKVWFYAHTRYAERPHALELAHNGTSLEVLARQLKPRELAREAAIEELRKQGGRQVTELAIAISKRAGVDQKTARGVITDLQVMGKVELEPLKGSASKLVYLKDLEVVSRLEQVKAEWNETRKDSLVAGGLN